MSTPARTTPPRYREKVVYGPFHRMRSDTQDETVMRQVLRGGELWGRTPRHGSEPAVQAYMGPLADDDHGFEFYASVPPDRPHGPHAYWRARADGSVETDDKWAKLKVLVSRVRQES